MSRPAIAWINLDHLRHNYRLLQQKAAAASVMAVVKANAYGHGLNLVAPVLFCEGCRQFAVTDAQEGSRLRDILNNKDQTRATEVVLLSGIFDSEDATLAAEKKLTPAINDPIQILLLQTAGFDGAVWIKVDTGMNRLGADNPQAMVEQCRQSNMRVRGIMSHLACADTPEHPMNRQQAELFACRCDLMDSKLPRSLLNSAGMVGMPDQRLDTVRPGIALYGAEPVADHPIGLKPVMRMTGMVMQIRNIEAGGTVSYTASFTADAPMRIAIVSAGYADGIPRPLSGCGQAVHYGKALPITGRICMDYTLLDVTNTDIDYGDSVEFWGPELAANEVAAMIDSISYTLFTGVSERVRRMPEQSG